MVVVGAKGTKLKLNDMKRIPFMTSLIFSVIFFLSAATWANGDKGSPEQKETRPFQATFITPFGTNGTEAPNIQNKFSLNILAGVNGGVQGFEAGGLANVIVGSVKGTQIAGLGNYVRDETTGAQLSGLFNVSRGYVKGLQGSGLLNVSLEGATGSQLSGILNVNTGDFTGLQATGLVNANTGNVNGMQAAGLVNYSGGDVTAGQISGLVNVGIGSTRGLQAAGLISVSAKAHTGSQISGLVNVASEQVSGSQISGIANYSKKVNGTQIALINVADSIGGVQVGLFSYAGNGFISLGAQSNETFQGSFVFKMGLKRFYNIYQFAGHNGDKRFWAYGLGFGTYLVDGRKIGLNLEGLAYHVNEDEWWTDKLNLLARLNLGLEYRITRTFAFTAGLSLNEAISQVRNEEGVLTGGSFVPDWTFHEHIGDKTSAILYPGLHAGIEFRLR